MKINGHNGDDGPSWPYEPRRIDKPAKDEGEKKRLGGLCLILLLAMLGLPALSIWGLVDFAEQVGRWTA